MTEILRATQLVMSAPYVEKEFIPIVQAQRDANCARGLPSVVKEGWRDARVAIVGFGPSLTETWPLILAGRFDAIWTVSKAHDFLVARGIIPTHHTDTDYREHKAHYNIQFQPHTRYWMATQVHPVYLDRLSWHETRLFHIVQPGGGTYSAGYFKLPVAFDAGLTAARLAYELGFRKQEWFGMDASMPTPEATHAGPHEGYRIIEQSGGESLAPFPVLVAGEPRLMNPFLVRQALYAERMLRDVPKLTVKIHGDGALRPFLQERGKCRVL